MNERRIIRLEEKVAYLEQALAGMEEVVGELNRRLVDMTRQMRELRSHASPLDPGREPEDDRPPHYGGFDPHEKQRRGEG
jgi:uncharacterized coiled-coil protein SlyX